MPINNIIINGLGIGENIVLGKVFYYSDEISVPTYSITEDEIEKEYQRFNNAIKESENQLNELQSSVANEIGDILYTHIIMLNDKVINNQIKETVARTKKNIDSVYNKIMFDYINKIRSLPDQTLAERSNDIMDVRTRVLRNLNNVSLIQNIPINTDAIIVAKNLTPSDTLHFRDNSIAGFAVETGGVTSHIAILARSLGIPAIVGLKNITSMINVGDSMIINGKTGQVIINPDEKIKAGYEITRALYKKSYEEGMLESQKKTIMLDNVEIDIAINIDTYEDTINIEKYGCKDIGLYRTEFLYMTHGPFPNENVQFEYYKNIFDSVEGTTTIRTLDLGGDKLADGYNINSSNFEMDENPFLGWRAIRFCLSNQNIFKTQLRAIFRASVYGKIRVIIPMISVVHEIIKIKEIIEEVKEQLRNEKIDFDDNIKLGAMIETPSAAISSDILAKHVDFFSIGSNDLIQYTLACDRTNEKVAYLYQPLDTSVLRLIKMISLSANKADINISLCGEMGASIIYCPVLLGLGIHSLSMSKTSVPTIKKTIRLLKMSECKKLVDVLFETDDTEEKKIIIDKFLKKANINLADDDIIKN